MLKRVSSHDVSPLAQSGTRSPISDSEVSSMVGSETTSRAASTTLLPEIDDLHQQQTGDLAATDGVNDEGAGSVGGVSVDDRQPIAVLPPSPKPARKALGANSLDMIEEGEEPFLTVPVVRRPRSHTDPRE